MTVVRTVVMRGGRPLPRHEICNSIRRAPRVRMGIAGQTSHAGEADRRGRGIDAPATSAIFRRALLGNGRCRFTSSMRNSHTDERARDPFSAPPESKPTTAFDPLSRIFAMAIGGALSLASTLMRGAWGWTAALAGGALVRRGVTGRTPSLPPAPPQSSNRLTIPVASNPGSVHRGDGVSSTLK
jgi:hypothetical protein